MERLILEVILQEVVVNRALMIRHSIEEDADCGKYLNKYANTINA